MTADAQVRLTLKDAPAPDAALALADLLGLILSTGSTTAAPVTALAHLLGDSAFTTHKEGLLGQAGLAAVQEAQTFLNCHDVSVSAGAEVVLSRELSETSARFEWSLPHTGGSDPTLETRVRFLKPDDVRTLATPVFQPRMAGPDALKLTTSPITDAHVSRYVNLAHDPNELHADAEVAMALGFEGIVVPGLLLCALAEAAVRSQFDGAPHQISDVRARFLSPCCVGQAVTLILASPVRCKSRVFVVGADRRFHAIVDFFSRA